MSLPVEDFEAFELERYAPWREFYEPTEPDEPEGDTQNEKSAAGTADPSFGLNGEPPF